MEFADPAKVTFTPTVQYLPFRLAGVVHCYIKANPTLQYVTWTKDKRLLEPYQTKDIVVMNNGSLLFTRVNENHQGRYTCTPYNAHGTQGSSGPMEVLVRNPPVFTLEPEPIYQKKVGETVEMHCDAQEAEGTQKPTIQWHRVWRKTNPSLSFLSRLSLSPRFLFLFFFCNFQFYASYQSLKPLGIALFNCAEGWRVHPTKSGQDRRREFNDRKPSPLGFRLLPVRGVQRGCHHIGLHAIDRRRHATPRPVQRNRYRDRVLGHVDLAAGILWRA